MFSLQKLLSFILENKSTQNFHAVSILRIHWRISMILKTSKQVYDVMFSDIKKYVYSESVFSALYIKIKHKYPKKTSLGQTKGTKNMLLFLSRALSHHSFTLRFLYELKHKVRHSKIACGIFHFWFRFAFIKLYVFVQQNASTL